MGTNISSNKDKVLFYLLVGSVFLVGIAAIIALARPIILEQAILLIQKYLSPDGIISSDTRQKINAYYSFGIYGLLALGSFGVLYWLVVAYIYYRFSDQPVHRQQPNGSPMTRTDTYLLGFVVLIGLFVYLHSIGRGFYYDELFSAYHFVDVETVWQTMSRYIVFNNHIFYSILSRISLSLFGREEWVLRLPALLFGLLSLIVFYRFIRLEYPRSVGFFATLLLAVNFSFTTWSVSARGYTGLIFFGLISNISYLSLLHTPSKVKWLIYISSCVLGNYIHLYSVSLILVQLFYVVFLLWQRPLSLSKDSFRLLAFSYPIIGALTSVLYLPVLGDLIRNISITGKNIVQWDFPIDLINEFSGNTGSILAVLLFIGFIWGLVYHSARKLSHGLFFLWLVVIPLLIVWLVFRPSIIYPRFFAFYLPYYIWFFTIGVWSVHKWLQKSSINRRISTFGMSILIVGLFLYWGSVSWSQVYEEAQYKEAVAFMDTNTTNTTSRCVFGSDAEILGYYTDRRFEILNTLSDYQSFTANQAKYICIYHSARWNKQEMLDMAAQMSRNSQAVEFKKVTVYIYR